MRNYRYSNAERDEIIVEDGERTTTVPRGHPAYEALVRGRPGTDDEPAIPPAVIADFVEDPNPVPDRVTRFQARAALSLAGMLDQAQAIVDASPDPLLKLAWADALHFERSSPTINALGGQLGLSSEAIDDLFRTAATISA